MISYIRYRFHLYRLEVEEEKIAFAYAEDIKKAKDQKMNWQKISSVESTERFELDNIWREKQELTSRRLIYVANKLSLPLPRYDDEHMWEQSSFTGVRMLSEEAQRRLTLAIRAERKDRSENARLWIAGITGLIGAISGLTALLLHK